MGWLSNIFSKTGSKVIESTGKALDDLLTSKEELNITKNEAAKIKAELEIRVKEILLEGDQNARDLELKLESELTKRQENDMKSDSWLSKNIRPMTLIFMTLAVVVLSFATIFNSTFNKEQLETIAEWIPFYQTIMLVIYGFYFGSRGLEKINKIKQHKNEA